MILPSMIYKSGLKVPYVGLGTFKLCHEQAVQSILDAYAIGYRLIDTATLYNNHRDIAKVFKTLKRENIILCSKINERDLVSDGVKRSCERILSELNTSYLDILLLHHPKVNNLHDVVDEMIALRGEGLVRSIGVSNFSIKHFLSINDLLQFIDVNQIEIHPFLYQPTLYQFCNENNIKLMAYRPFAHDLLAESQVLNEIAKKHDKSWRQIVLRWLVQHDMQVIAKASSRSHLEANFAIFDFELSPLEMQSITALNQKIRTCIGDVIDFSDLS